MSLRIRFVAVVLGALASVSAVVVLVSSSASASSGGQRATRNVIVVLRNQDRAHPATKAGLGRRQRAVRSQQAPLLSSLSKAHAKNVHGYLALNAVSATVTPGEAAALRRDPAVAEVVPNGLVHLAPPTPATDASATPATNLPGPVAPDPKACAKPGTVQLNPEALQTMHVDSDNPAARTARSLGITGAGIKVGYIADALDINNPDFIRADGSHVFADAQDFSGFGIDAPTAAGESFGDASMIAAQGRQTYNISHYSNFTDPRPCDIRIEGVAPGASLYGLFAFGESDVAPDSSILEAIDYAIVTAHVNVLNESFGINNYPDDIGTQDLISQANDQAVAAGITVVESTGDAGPTNTIGEASDDPNVISAGATTDYRLYDQIGYGGAALPQVHGWLNDNTSSFDSSGFDQRGRTIDVVAPGEDGWALCTPNTALYASCSNLRGNPSNVEQFGGTSMSSPLTAGVAALVIQAFEKTHNGTPPSPALVKQIIVSNTDDVSAPAEQMGTGRVDAYKAVLAAENFGQPAGGGSTTGKAVGVLTTSQSQLNAIDQPGTAESLTDTVTNQSESTQNLSFSSRTIGTYQSLVNQTLTLSDSEPTFPDYVPGLSDKFQKVTFTVPAGMGRLNASVAYQGAGAFPGPVKLALIDPKGRLTSYSVPQGVGNFGNVQVSTPKAGNWKAYVFSRTPSGGGYDGPVQLGISAAPFTSFGTVNPSSATLAPGQSVAVQEQVSTPADPGDTAGAIVVQSSNAKDPKNTTSTTIPVTMRSLIPIASGSATFGGTVTGGNGRAPISGQEFFYEFDVANGVPELNADISVQDAGNQFGAYLINPQGEAVAYGTNMIPSAADPTTPTTQAGAQLHTLSPAAGRWRLAIVFAPAAAGDTLSSPFTVNLNEQPATASASALPDSASTTLPAGQPVTVPVSITNSGTSPELVFPDARLQGSTSLSLGAVNGATDDLPQNDNIPSFLVPTNSTQFNAAMTASVPVQFESQFVGGDPDLASTTGTNPMLSLSDNPIATGEWDVLPVEVGPFGAAGAPAGTSSASVNVVTRPFDTAVTSPTGDLEADSADPATSLGSFNPTVVAPGQTATINVTITPSGSAGTVVSGTLFVDDTAFFEFGSIQDALVNFPQADQAAALAYEYTVG
jgi:hypothetical protein